MAVVKSLLVELFVVELAGALAEVGENEAFEKKYVAQSAGCGVLFEPGGHVAAVGKETFLAHKVDVADDGFFAHAKDVGKIVDTAFGFVAVVAGGSAADERTDDADCLLARGVVEEWREGEAAACLVHAVNGDAGGKDVGYVVASFEIAGFLKCGYGSLDTSVEVFNLIVPTGLSGYLEGGAADAFVFGGEVAHGTPYLLYVADA